MKSKETMYLVKLDGQETYSLFSFVGWAEQKQLAKKYTKEQAEKLIKEIPAHIGKGVLVVAL